MLSHALPRSHVVCTAPRIAPSVGLVTLRAATMPDSEGVESWNPLDAFNSLTLRHRDSHGRVFQSESCRPPAA